MMYDVLSSRHERVKRRVANKKQSKSRDPVLEPVQPNNKKLITVDPASFSCKYLTVDRYHIIFLYVSQIRHIPHHCLVSSSH